MTTAHVDVLDRSIEKTHIWLNELADELETGDAQHAYRVLRAYLHTLRDHLSTIEAAQFAAQLPIFIRGIFYEGWEPGHADGPGRGVESFLDRIAREAGLSGETEASFAAVAANRVVRHHVSAGEHASVMHALPHQLRDLLTSHRG